MLAREFAVSDRVDLAIDLTEPESSYSLKRGFLFFFPSLKIDDFPSLKTDDFFEYRDALLF